MLQHDLCLSNLSAIATTTLPAGLVDERWGIAREILWFPMPAGFPDFCQISIPLTHHRRLTGREQRSDRDVFYGAAFETSFDRALVAASAEAIERYSGTMFSDDEFVHATGEELGTAAGLADHLIGFSPRTLRRSGCPYRPYDPRVRRRWIAGTSLLDGRKVYMPAQAVIFDLHLECSEENIVPSNTNGLAAGLNIEHAACSALLELIERDAFACHWLLRKSPIPLAIDEAAFESFDPQLRELCTSTAVDAQLRLLETDMGVPVVLAFIRGRESGAISVGASARLSVREAARKALLEAAHCWVFVAERRARRAPVPCPSKVSDFLDHAAYYADPAHATNLAFLIGLDREPRTLSESECCFPESADVTHGGAACLAQLVDRITAAGFEPLLFNRTAEDAAELGYTVVRALIPGLHPLWVGDRWIADDHRRLAQMTAFHGLASPFRLNRRIHPFP